MKKKVLLILGIALFSLASFAQSKQDIGKALDAMAGSGHLDSVQVEQARKELDKMSDADLKNLIEAGKKMQNDPGIRKKIKEMGLDQGF